ncbi:MAG: hypothetical protein IJ653_01335, partial [Bacteroidales bacterium]|nr:hypothetical protein [Bacteroidales bacterium]
MTSLGNVTPASVAVFPGSISAFPGSVSATPGIFTVIQGGITATPASITATPASITVIPDNLTVIPGCTTVIPDLIRNLLPASCPLRGWVACLPSAIHVPGLIRGRASFFLCTILISSLFCGWIRISVPDSGLRDVRGLGHGGKGLRDGKVLGGAGTADLRGGRLDQPHRLLAGRR